MKTLSIMIALVTLLVFAFEGVADSNEHDLFQQALVKERVQRNMEDAIALYQTIIQVTDNEALAAEAQLRIGMCYEALGMENAQRAYQKVIDNYPTQDEPVRMARAQLSVLHAARTILAKDAPGFTMRRVGPGWGHQGEISPDGRYLTGVDWTTGDLAILDLTTGEDRRLTDKGSWLESDAMAFQSRWSPDGKHIAFDWWDWTEPGFVGVRIVEADGSNLRDLLQVEHCKTTGSMIYDWSPDGEAILAYIIEGQRGKVVLISVADGSVTPLKEFDTRPAKPTNNMGFSPCGEYIIYDYPSADSPNINIYLLSRDGKSEITLVEHPANDRFLEWIPQGNNVLFISDRRGSMDLWRLPMDGAIAAGAPELLQEGIGHIYSRGLTDSGAFYYCTYPGDYTIYIASLDSESGAVAEPPRLPVQHLGRSAHSPAYSPNAKYLAYISQRGVGVNERSVICIRSLDSGKDRELFTEYNNVRTLHWSPDSRFILAQAGWWYSGLEHAIILSINVESGEVSQVYRCEHNQRRQRIRFPLWSHDESVIFYMFADNIDREHGRQTFSLISRDLSSGREAELYCRDSSIFSLSISPDGQWLAFVSRGKENERHIRVIPSSGGDIQNLLTFEESANWATSIAWSSDGKYLLFSQSRCPDNDPSYIGNRSELWRISVEGGQPEKMGLTMYRFYSLGVHPDGHHLVFSSLGHEEPQSELWVMEKFLPEVDPEGK